MDEAARTKMNASFTTRLNAISSGSVGGATVVA
jgi:hypothetical protein